MPSLKIIWLSLTFLFSVILNPDFGLAKSYFYTDLEVKDLEQMRKLVQPLVVRSNTLLKQKRAEKDDDKKEVLTSEAITVLREAMKIIFSRPNKDNMVSKLIEEVRSSLSVLKMYDVSLEQLSISSITALKQSSLPAKYMATQIFILENIMSQTRPGIKNNKTYEKIFERIKEAKIEVPKKVIQFRKMRGMHKTASPSLIAESILKKDLK